MLSAVGSWMTRTAVACSDRVLVPCHLLCRYETLYKKNKAKADEENELQVTSLERLLPHEIRRLLLTVVLTILLAGASRCEEDVHEEGGAGQASRQAL